jgi:ribosomal protein S17E
MGIVVEKLLSADARSNVVVDCVSLVDREVASKSGLTGIMIKGGYKTFKAIKPSIVKDAVEILLDYFVPVMDGHYEEYLKADPGKSTPFASWAKERDMRLADDMLKITDEMMNRSSKTVIKKIYSGMRTIAQKNVALAVPGIAGIIVKHVD